MINVRFVLGWKETWAKWSRNKWTVPLANDDLHYVSSNVRSLWELKCAVSNRANDNVVALWMKWDRTVRKFSWLWEDVVGCAGINLVRWQEKGGIWGATIRVRILRSQKSLFRPPGYSWIESHRRLGLWGWDRDSSETLLLLTTRMVINTIYAIICMRDTARLTKIWSNDEKSYRSECASRKLWFHVISWTQAQPELF